MSASIVLGNGNLLVNFNEEGFIEDLYWPHVGKENHLQGHHIKIFFWVDGEFSSCTSGDGCWNKEYDYEEGTLIGKFKFINEKLGLIVTLEAGVCPDMDVLIELIHVENLFDRQRDVRIFFTHDFYIKEHNIGDTCAWYPYLQLLTHYKDDRYLSVGSKYGVYQYHCEQSHHEGGKSIIPDIQTGQLRMNPISQGSVESAISFKLMLKPKATESFDYFILCGKRYDEIKDLMNKVKSVGPADLLEQSRKYWKVWLGAKVEDKKKILDKLRAYEWDDASIARIKELYERSLLIIRTQVDNGGAIIAANTSKSMHLNRDTYSYMWAADGAFVSLALDKSGFPNLTKSFYEFCARFIAKDGYLLHKYTPTGHLGSSWHPWVDQAGNPQLPIQEDETALPIFAIWEHYKIYKDHEILSELWTNFIEKAADFLDEYRYRNDINLAHVTDFSLIPEDWSSTTEPLPQGFSSSGFPKASYDRWEQRRGVNTFTCCSVIAGLEAAAFIAQTLGYTEKYQQYNNAAIEIKNKFLSFFYSEKHHRFIRMLRSDYKRNECLMDLTIDALLHAVWMFNILPLDDSRVVSTVEQIEENLWLNTEIGGICRNENDAYYRHDASVAGNPWYITTLWTAQYYLKRGEMKKAYRYIKWVSDHADHTGILPEQADPYTGISISVKPLTWSHAEYINMVENMVRYLENQN